MDYNLLLGIAGIVLTILGLFFAGNIQKNRINGNKNTIIGTQINHGLNLPKEKVDTGVIFAESIDHLRKYHKCSHCKFGFKYFQTTDQLTTSSFQQVPTIKCPSCKNEDIV